PRTIARKAPSRRSVHSERMRPLPGAVLALFACCCAAPAQHPAADKLGPAKPGSDKPGSDKLTYGVEWRLIRAGRVTLEFQKSHATMRLESAGIVSALIKIADVYNADYQDGFCATSSVMDSMEGKRHHDTRVTYDRSQNRAFFVERDMVKNAVIRET